MTIRVDGQEGLARALARISERLRDFRPLWDRLDGGPFNRAVDSPLGSEMRAVWDRRFDAGFRHSVRTIRERQAARGGRRTGRGGGEDSYYEANPPGPRAKDDAPYLEWTGATRAAASKFTTREPLNAAIDPVEGYPDDGPLADEGGWNATLAGRLRDSDVFRTRSLDQMLEREAEKWLEEEFAR